MSRRDQPPNPSDSSIRAILDASSGATSSALLPFSRRQFLAGGMAGATTIALSPLQKLLAAPAGDYLSLASAYENRGLWLLYQFGRGFAHSIGFGWALDTALALIDQFVLDGKIEKWQKKNAEAGLGAAWDMILSNRNLYGAREYRSLTEPVVDAGRLLQTVFTKVSTKQSASALFRRAGFSAQPEPADKRYFATSFCRDELNLLAPFFDYEGNKFDPRAVLGRPSLTAYQRLLERLAQNFSTEQVRQMTFPKKQLQTSYGVQQASYKNPDTYEGAAGTTVEMFYEHKGRYLADDAKTPTEQYGYVNISLHGFECPTTRKRQGECKLRVLITYDPMVA